MVFWPETACHFLCVVLLFYSIAGCLMSLPAARRKIGLDDCTMQTSSSHRERVNCGCFYFNEAAAQRFSCRKLKQDNSCIQEAVSTPYTTSLCKGWCQIGKRKNSSLFCQVDRRRLVQVLLQAAVQARLGPTWQLLGDRRSWVSSRRSETNVTLLEKLQPSLVGKVNVVFFHTNMLCHNGANTRMVRQLRNFQAGTS